MATAATVKTRALRRVGDPDQKILNDDDLILDWFNDVLKTISRDISKWDSHPFGQETDTLTLVSPEYRAFLPDDYLRYARNQDGVGKIYNATEDYTRMTENLPSEVEGYEDEDSSDTGTPTHYYFLGDEYLCVHPRPDADTTIKLYYFPERTIASINETLPWSGRFDGSIEKYVILQMRQRLQQVGLVDVAYVEFRDQLSSDIQRVYLDGGFRFKPASNCGWPS